MYTLPRNHNAQEGSYPLVVILSWCSSPLLGILVHLVNAILQQICFLMNKTTNIAIFLKEIITT